MSEEVAREQRAGERRPGDPLAFALSLSAAAHEARVAAKSEAYLEEQTRLTMLQARELALELHLRHWSLRVRHVSDILKLAFEFAAALVLIAVAAFIAAQVWSASHDNSVVIESFDVPSDFAARGLTGKVIAGKLLDRLAALQIATTSARPASTYKNNWGDDFQVRIPDTGVSLGEAIRYLHSWLGHQTTISGALYRTDKGIAIVTRVGDASMTVSGPAANLDALVEQSAEAVYGTTQPYRYATYVARTSGDIGRARALFQAIADNCAGWECAWADIGLHAVKRAQGDVRGGMRLARAAVDIEPDFILALQGIEWVVWGDHSGERLSGIGF